jgi:hypothetical protein
MRCSPLNGTTPFALCAVTLLVIGALAAPAQGVGHAVLTRQTTIDQKQNPRRAAGHERRRAEVDSRAVANQSDFDDAAL